MVQLKYYGKKLICIYIVKFKLIQFKSYQKEDDVV